VLSAIEYIHYHNFVHMDFKRANIFVDYSGSWWIGSYDSKIPEFHYSTFFVGGFGSAVTVGDIIRSTPCHYCINVAGEPAAPAYDYYMLCVLLVEMMTLGTSPLLLDCVELQLDCSTLDTRVRDAVWTCPNDELKSLMLKLLSQHDEYLSKY
jgi:serine/threonine protein kinase